jgi:hypothetical protein
VTNTIWIGIIFGAIFFLGGIFLPSLHPVNRKVTIGMSVLVFVVLGLKFMPFEENSIKFEDRQTAPRVIGPNICIAQKPSSTTAKIEEREKKEKSLAANEKPLKAETRSPEELLIFATQQWRKKELQEALRLVDIGLDLNPQNIRTHATLVHRKGSIFADFGKRDIGLNFIKKCFV